MEPPAQPGTVGVVRRAEHRVMCLPVYAYHFSCLVACSPLLDNAPLGLVGRYLPCFRDCHCQWQGVVAGGGIADRPATSSPATVTVAAPGLRAGSDSPSRRRAGGAPRLVRPRPALLRLGVCPPRAGQACLLRISGGRLPPGPAGATQGRCIRACAPASPGAGVMVALALGAAAVVARDIRGPWQAAA